MTTLIVTYAGEAGTRFDRDYYVETHMRMVREDWGPLGMESGDAFLPAGDGGGTFAVSVCRFRDGAALEAALASPLVGRLNADRRNFTDVVPTLSRAVAF